MTTFQADFERLVEQVGVWNGRRRLRDLLLWLPKGTLAGLLTAVIIATLARWRPLLTNQEVGYIALGCGLAGLTLTIGWVVWQRYTLHQQARFADKQFVLEERVTTAVEIHDQKLTVPPQWATQQLNDTLNATAQVDVQTQLPYEINTRDWGMVLLAIALLVVAVLLPNPQEEILLQQRTIKTNIEEQIEALEALQEEILENPELTEEQQEELLEPIEDALEGLDDGAVSQSEAVATLSEAEAELRDLYAENDQSALQEQLDIASDPLQQNQNTQSLGDALNDGNLSQAGSEMAQLADQLPSLNSQELANLAQDLAQTAEALAGVDTELSEELTEAAEALQNGDIEAAQQALQEAAATLQQRAQQNATAQQAQNAAGQLNEGRQEVAEAGQPQTGEGQQGEGQSQGEGQGQGQGQGQGEGQGQGQGEGQGQGQGQGQGEGQGQQGGVGGNGYGGGHTENVYVPPLVDLSGEQGVEIELPAECVNNPADCGGLLNETPTDFTEEGSVVPYDQVYGDYRDAAYEALSDDYIPLGMKEFVRDYFSSLEP